MSDTNCTKHLLRQAYVVCVDAIPALGQSPSNNPGVPLAVCLGTSPIIRYHDGPGNCAVWQAIGATSAAPTYFRAKKISIQGRICRFLDGAMYYNNPIATVPPVIEALDLENWETEVSYLSIGTGMVAQEARRRNYWYADPAVSNFGRLLPSTLLCDLKRYLKATGGNMSDLLEDARAESAYLVFQRMVPSDQYFRFDCDGYWTDVAIWIGLWL